MTDAELDHLEGVALMADYGGRRWIYRPNDKGYPQRIQREGDAVLVADCFEGPQYPPLFTDFITSFDPPTALRLIAKIRALSDGRSGS